MAPPFSVFLLYRKLQWKMTKKELRKIYREKRESLTLGAKHAMLAGMQECFREIPIISKARVFSYKTITARNEVDTSVFEELLSTEYDAAAFCYPAIPSDGGAMEAYLDNEEITWEEVGFGLTQPASGKMVSPHEIDIVLVPLLAFDCNGQRLGYGKGFYDGYLSRCRPDVLSIGLSWFEPEQTLPEIGAHDVPLKYCVTPQRLYVF
jgi:5-formyltetrahydrofolate cyclo-ligase